jgi:hypothetical protein
LTVMVIFVKLNAKIAMQQAKSPRAPKNIRRDG